MKELPTQSKPRKLIQDVSSLVDEERKNPVKDGDKDMERVEPKGILGMIVKSVSDNNPFAQKVKAQQSLSIFEDISKVKRKAYELSGATAPSHNKMLKK